MDRFRLGHSTGPDWRASAEACAQQIGRVAAPGAIGFVYVTDAHADHFGDIVARLREATDVESWFGTVGIGVCATDAETFDGPGIAALVGTFPAGAATPLGEDTHAEGAFGVVHAVPTDRAVIDGIAARAKSSGAYLVGGLASSRGAHVTVAGTRIARTGLSGVLFASEVAVATGLTQGCVPLGPVHRVTAGAGTVVATVDGERALDVLAADLARTGDARGAAAGLQVAFPIAGSDTGDYLVRNLMGVDNDNGALAVAHDVAPGDAIQFRRRDEAAARADLARMLRDLKRRAPDPRGAVYFSCLARGPNLFGPDGDELHAIAEAFPGLPLAGFFGNGEICAGRLYAYTGVLALFL